SSIASTTGSYNIYTSTTCILSPDDTDILVDDPLLLDLADNGGPTWTHLPSELSLAINAIDDCSILPATDQRGVARPQPENGLCDIGATEVRMPTLSVPENIIEEATGPDGEIIPFTVTATNGDGSPLPVDPAWCENWPADNRFFP